MKLYSQNVIKVRGNVELFQPYVLIARAASGLQLYLCSKLVSSFWQKYSETLEGA